MPGPATLGLAATAGLLTLLNPCVLSLLPVVAGAASQRSRAGLLALGLGLALAFTAVGVAVAASGVLLGVEQDQWRLGAAGLMVAFGAVLVSPPLRAGFQRMAQGLGTRGHSALARVRADHPLAQAGIGVLLGIAWTPCIGPTLGAAIGLAATGRGTADAAWVMGVFSVAAVLPLIALGLASGQLLARRKTATARAGRLGQRALGISLVVIGLLVLTGLDKTVEGFALDHSPPWLIELTTRV